MRASYKLKKYQNHKDDLFFGGKFNHWVSNEIIRHPQEASPERYGRPSLRDLLFHGSNPVEWLLASLWRLFRALTPLPNPSMVPSINLQIPKVSRDRCKPVEIIDLAQPISCSGEGWRSYLRWRQRQKMSRCDREMEGDESLGEEVSAS